MNRLSLLILILICFLFILLLQIYGCKPKTIPMVRSDYTVTFHHSIYETDKHQMERLTDSVFKHGGGIIYMPKE